LTTTLELRPASDADRDFLCRLYAATRDREMALLAWSAGQKQVFLRQQFEAQWSHYSVHFAGGSNDIILVDGQAAGRLFVDRTGADIVLVDVALLPAFRGFGLGSRLVSALIDEAGRSRRRIAGHVERWNPAQRLWARLGFQVVDEGSMYLRLLWEPAAQTR
jgi:GNAT superfamily N-acetyltransferase